jgi:hypothetical protein
MPTTPNFAIPYPDGTTSLTPLQDKFADIANAVDSALVSGLAGAPRQITSDAQRTSVFPSPVQGNLANRPDKGYVEVYLATYDPSTNKGGAAVAGWYPLPGTVLGSNQVIPNALVVTGVTAIAGLSATTYCPGTAVKISFEGLFENSSSGAHRELSAQIYEDGTAIGVARDWFLGLLTSQVATCNLNVFRTPTAGIHTYTARTNTAVATSVTNRESSIVVTALAPKV